MSGGSYWQAIVRGADGTPASLAVIRSSVHPDGLRVELTDAELAGHLRDAICVVGLDGGAVRRLDVRSLLAPKAPPLWFAELTESAQHPPADNLLAFSGHDVVSGQLLDAAALAEVDVSTSDQLGAVRWYPTTGEVDQVYVGPDHRRRHIAQAVLVAAGCLSVARGWARLWGDGQRTELGEQMRDGSDWRHRMAELTHVAPPMTPDEAG